MTALWILLAIVAFFILFLSVPIHITLKADTDVAVEARVLFVKYALFPRKRHKKKPSSAKKTQKNGSKPAKNGTKTTPKPKPKRDILGLVKLISKLAVAVLKKFPKHFRVKIVQYEISIGTDDAAKTALLYGAVTGLSANLFALLRKATKFRIKRGAPVNVYVSFLSEKSEAKVILDLSITIWGALVMAMAAGMAFVKEKMAVTSEKAEKTKNQSEEQNKK